MPSVRRESSPSERPPRPRNLPEWTTVQGTRRDRSVPRRPPPGSEPRFDRGSFVPTSLPRRGTRIGFPPGGTRVIEGGIEFRGEMFVVLEIGAPQGPIDRTDVSHQTLDRLGRRSGCDSRDHGRQTRDRDTTGTCFRRSGNRGRGRCGLDGDHLLSPDLIWIVFDPSRVREVLGELRLATPPVAPSASKTIDRRPFAPSSRPSTRVRAVAVPRWCVATSTIEADRRTGTGIDQPARSARAGIRAIWSGVRITRKRCNKRS